MPHIDLYSTLLSMAILIGFGMWIYSAFKKQSIKDTIMEIKELIKTATATE